MSTVTALHGVLQSAGLGTPGVDLLGGLLATVPPTGAGPFTHVVAYGGELPDETHDDGGTAIDRPRVQVVVHAATTAAAEARAQQCQRALSQVTNRLIDGTRYLRVVPIQPPFDLGPDATGRARWAFNVAVAVEAP
jgi:hypothetical protein